MISPANGAAGAHAITPEAVPRPLSVFDPVATRATFARLLQRLSGVSAPRTLELEPNDGDGATLAASTRANDNASMHASDRAAGLRALVERVASPERFTPAHTSPVLLMPTVARDEPVGDAAPAATRAERAEHTERTERTRRSDLSSEAGLTHALTALDPVFRNKVERVIERMRDEHGRDVTVSETHRSQSRQDDLYEQGRTRPGAVVTWTRHSRHTDGMAADLMINGSWNDAEGYAQLQQIAKEEGLVTLGAKDPGHLELSADDALGELGKTVPILDAEIGVHGVGSAKARVVATAQLAQVAALASVASVAKVAPTATLASVASNATVAQTAPIVSDQAMFPAGRRAGASQTMADTSHNAPVLTATPPGVASATPTNGAGLGDSSSNSRTKSAARDRAEQLASILGNDRAPANDSLWGIAGSTGVLPLGAGALARAMTGATGSAAAARAAELLALQDARDAQPISHMLLRIENGTGGEDRIRVDVRGQSVDAKMLMDDAESAQQAASRVSELATALGVRGLKADVLSVRSGIPAADLARVLHAATVDPSALRAPTGTTALPTPHARSGGDSTASRQQSDTMRQRSRRQPNGGQS